MGERRRAFEELVRCVAGDSCGPLDWGSLIQLAGETLTIGSLAEAVLHQSDRKAPPEIEALLIEVRRRSILRNERLTGQLRELLRTLNRIGIEPVAMKGIARVLKQPKARTRLLSDIDLLVPAQCRGDCLEALKRLDYHLVRGAKGDPAPLELARSKDVGMVDLHTSIPPRHLGLTYEALARVSTSMDTSAGRLLVPNATGELLLIVVHDQLHDADYWRGLVDLRHLIDIEQLVDEGIDWGLLASFFPKGCARNALQVQLRTAKTVLGCDIPQIACGGSWARMQVRRRLVQMDLHWLRQPLTLATLALDPPLDWDGYDAIRQLRRRRATSKLKRLVRPVNHGKMPPAARH